MIDIQSPDYKMTVDLWSNIIAIAISIASYRLIELITFNSGSSGSRGNWLADRGSWAAVSQSGEHAGSRKSPNDHSVTFEGEYPKNLDQLTNYMYLYSRPRWMPKKDHQFSNPG